MEWKFKSFGKECGQTGVNSSTRPEGLFFLHGWGKWPVWHGKLMDERTPFGGRNFRNFA